MIPPLPSPPHSPFLLPPYSSFAFSPPFLLPLP
jgi:hypothetical protein